MNDNISLPPIQEIFINIISCLDIEDCIGFYLIKSLKNIIDTPFVLKMLKEQFKLNRPNRPEINTFQDLYTMYIAVIF